MKSALAAALGALLSAALAGFAQDKTPASSSRTGVLNLRDCLDKARNHWMADIEAELQKLQDADAGRANDLNPQERLRIRTRNLEVSNRKRLEVYTALVRMAGILAHERGLDTVLRSDRIPAPDPAEPDLWSQLDHRSVIYADPAVDLTSELLERLNREYAAKPK